MHILIIPSWYPSTDNPLSGIFFRQQAIALREAGHQVGVLTNAYDSITRIFRRGFLPFVSKKVEDGIPVYHARQPKLIPLMAISYQSILMWNGMNAYRKYLKDYGKPDVIQAHSILYGGVLAVQIKYSDSIPVVVTEHSSKIFNGQVNNLQLKAIKSTLRNADQNCAVSRALASALQNYVPGLEVEVVGNMVDGEIFHPSTGQPLPEKPFIFILIARLKANKGVDLLLHAFSQLKREKNALLYVAGGGPELDNLKQLASTLGIQDLVNFLGPVSHEQVGDLLRESHVLVSTSYIETFGVSLIEALACGKPVIATRSGGPSDIVHEKNGILFSPGDIAALSSALEQMINTYSTYNPEMIRADCLARFGKEAIIQRLERIYCQVLK